MALRLARSLAARGRLDFAGREGLSSFLAAALCHDLGHFPYAHSLKELPLEGHETLTARLLAVEPLRSLVGAAGADPDAAAAIVDRTLPDGGDREIRFFRGLLSGVLDPDKLDYLNRDAFYCGVPYGIQDVDFLLQRLDLGPGDRLGIEERGLMGVESLLFSKYLMYRSVYWHKGVRAATSMAKKAVLLALDSGALQPEELYGLDDDGFHALMRSLGGGTGPRAWSAPGPAALAEAVFEGRTFETVLDLPYEAANPRHAVLADLGSRLRAEEELAARASVRGGAMGPLDLVIDLPEPISFETDLPVLGPGGIGATPFTESPTVFSPPVVAGFAAALRRVRVFAARPGEAVERAARDLLA
jgi:HD superfamily phosphohydrolase